MAFPTTISATYSWPVTGSGNLGPFLYGGNVYILVCQVNAGSTDEIQMLKATDPTSSFSEADGSNAPVSGGTTTDNVGYLDAHQSSDGRYIYLYWCNSGVVEYNYRWTMFDCANDKWMHAPDGTPAAFFNPTDNPATAWGGITVRSDGDIIIVHPGENPSTMGGTYQEVAYTRIEIAASVSDATNGIEFDATNDRIIRADGGSWVTDGFSTSTNLLIMYAEDATNNRYIVNGRISSVTDSTIQLSGTGAGDITETNAGDTSVVVSRLTTTAGTVVASTAAKNDNYQYAYVVMGSSDQCHFGYVRDTDSDFYLRALSSANALRTQRTNAGTYTSVKKGIDFTRSSTEKIAFEVRNGNTHYRLYFTHFTDDTSPTITEETITTGGYGSYEAFHAGLCFDSLATNQDNYVAYINNINYDIYVTGDDGGTTWSDQNGSSAVQAGTFQYVSANVHSRGGFRVVGILFGNGLSVFYTELSLYSLATDTSKPFRRRAVRFALMRF